MSPKPTCGPAVHLSDMRVIPAVNEMRVVSVVWLRSVVCFNEFLDKIGDDQSTSAIEMDPVRVKLPAIDPGDFVRTLAQYHSAESISIKSKKPKLRESATWRFHNFRKYRFMQGNIVSALFLRNSPDNAAELIDALIEFPLEGVCRCGIFSDRRQRTERNCGRVLSLRPTNNFPKVFTEPFG
jgi:hypothetical protein